MDAGTWVALVLGLGSLGTTLILDRRNRAERTETAKRADADRDRQREAERTARAAERLDDRWSRDKQIAYADLCGEVFGWFDDITDRDSKRIAMAPGSTWTAADQDRWRQVIASRGAVDLLAPSEVRNASILAITAVILYAAEVRTNANPLAATTEREPAFRLTNAMRDAMRADLGVPESAPLPGVGDGRG